LGFGSLRTLEGQFELLGERMLLSVVQTLGGGDHRTYVGPPDVHYLLEYPLVNKWTYEVAFGQLGKNHRTYAPLARRPLLFRPINTLYPFRVVHKF
jgi:hypothetical protein